MAAANGTLNNDLQSMLQDSKAVYKVFLYIFPVVGTVGFVTNAMSIYIFLFCWPEKSRQPIYYAFLAFADNLCLLMPGWLYQFAYKFFDSIDRFDIAYKISKSTDASCKLYRYFESVHSTMAATALVLIVVDRAFSVYFPMKANRITRKHAWIACGVTLVFSILAVLPFGLLRKLTAVGPVKSWKCNWSAPSIGLQIYRTLISHVPALQTIIILSLNIAILVKVIRETKNRKKMNGKYQKGTLSSNEISFSIVALLLSVVFTLCAVVQIVGFFIGFLYTFIIKDGDPRISRIGWTVGDIGWHIFFIQESTSFFIYLGRLKEFRKIVKKKFCCCFFKQEKAYISKTSEITAAN